MTEAETWQAAKSELELQMTKATFNSWLSSAELVGVAGNEWQIAVRNDAAREWVENRLAQTISRALASIIGHPVALRFLVRDTEHKPGQAPLFLDYEDAPAPPKPAYQLPDIQYAGISEDTWGNFTQIPNDLLDLALPYVRPTTAILILVTFRNTLGTITSKRGDRRHEWPTSIEDARRQTAIGRASIYTAIWESRAMGFLIQRRVFDPTERRRLSQQAKIKVEFTLRPRLADEDVDYPDEPKPQR
jgi:chromosomal replication initiation ATPase DnaA